MKRFMLLTMALFCTLFSYADGNTKDTAKNSAKSPSVSSNNGAPVTSITLNCNNKTMDATLANNESTNALIKLLKKSPITLNMHDYGGFEKSGSLNTNLTQSNTTKIVRSDSGAQSYEVDTIVSTTFTANPGDIILFNGDTIAIYYGRNSYNFTKLGTVTGATEKNMKTFLSAGGDNINLTISLKEDTNMKNKILVAYFSATGTTKSIARAIADSTGGVLYEISPVTPYSAADLNWHDSNSRSSKECNNKNFRSPIKGALPNIDDYDTVFLGFPIWWGVAPSIIQTFLESSNFAGKRIALFCTSGSSGIGGNEALLKKSAPDATFIGGKRFPANDAATAKVWALSLLKK